jgi:nucleoside-diphosphate-sugar epimerase
MGLENNRIFKEMKINKLVFVTGISGFVGQNLKPYLSTAFEIKSISRKGKNGSMAYEPFLNENIAYDALVHLAGKAHDLKKTSNTNDYYEANFELTKKLYDRFLQSKAEKFIFISSVKAVADSVDGILTEDHTPNPATAYGKSKRMAEEYILAHLPLDKKVYILRPCMIHGLGNKGNLNLLFSMVKKGFYWPLGAFKNQRSFCSIENLCFLISELLHQESIPSGVYNVADDERFSTNELIGLIALSQNKKSRVLRLPKRLIRWGAQIGDVLHLPLNSERLQKLTESYVVSNTKIKKAIGKPFPVSSKEGLLTTFSSFEK